MNVLITGGTGFLGKPLVHELLKRKDKAILLVRDVNKAREIFADKTILVSNLEEIQAPVDAVVNLAGEPIFDKRWTPTRKEKLLSSRVDTTKTLVSWINSLKQKPEVLVSGSAIGYYGNHPGSQPLNENAEAKPCFSSLLCQLWEAEAKNIQDPSIRLCFARTGVVLDKEGGALARMIVPYRFGLGGVMGSGDQWFSWIHLRDMIALLLFLLDNKSISGPVNATAPNAVRHKEFSKLLAKTMNRPVFFPMPEFVVKIIFGESSELLIQGQRVFPKRLIENGFEFKFKDLESTLRNILKK